MAGIVLAGGESRRMGRDKALLPLDGRPLVAWTVDRLAPQCGRLAISRHDGALEGVDLGLPILADEGGPRAGPLGGLLAGLDWVARVDPAASHAVTVAVDSPFLPGDFVARLAAALRAAGTSAAVACSGGRHHPVAALWPVSARIALRQTLHGERMRRVGLFLDRLSPAVVPWATEPFDPFLNLNTPGDVATAEAIAVRFHATTLRQTGEPPSASRRRDDE